MRKDLMAKLTIDDLDVITARVRRTMVLREGAGRAKITVHMGTCGIAAGAKDVMRVLREEFDKNTIEGVILTSSGCAGLCSREPMATVELHGRAPIKYGDLDAEKTLRVLNEHVREGKVVSAYAIGRGSEKLS